MKKYDCGFTKENNWFRYRAAAIIVENDCVLFAGNELEDYYYSIGGGVHMGVRDLTLNNISWTDANIDNMHFSNAHIINAEFRASTIRRIIFDESQIEGIDVFKAKISEFVASYLKKYAKNIVNFKTAVIYEDDKFELDMKGENTEHLIIDV